MADDRRLLQQYARHNSRPALEELVRRNLDLVYSAALRQVRNPDLAEDVTQAVFLVLAQKAASIREGMALGGWLLAVTRYAAVSLLRQRAMQQRHESMVAQTHVESSPAENEAAWQELLPHLDAEMMRLSTRDRDAVVLRFFQNRSFADIGSHLAISEDAAQKRVSRALAQLRQLLTRRGVTLSAAVIATAIAGRAIEAAPAQLLPATVAGLGSGAVAASSTAKGVLAMIAWSKLKAAAALILAAGLISGAAFEVAYFSFRSPEPTVAATGTAPATQDSFVAVSGVVVDAAGKPAGNVKVEHQIPAGALLSATSTADGKFTMKSAREIDRLGDYLATSADGNFMGYLSVQGATTTAPANELRLVLRPARSLPLTVTDAADAPVDHATLGAFADYEAVARATTDAQGRGILRFPADAPLSSVAAFKDNVGLDYAVFWLAGSIRNDPYRLDLAATQEVHLKLTGSRTVKIHVTDDKKTPLAGANVSPWYFTLEKKGDDFNVSFEALNRRTDANGDATFNFIPAANQQSITFWVRKHGFTAQDRFQFDPKEKSADLAATLLKMIPIGGRVLDDEGQPVAGATVRVGGAGYAVDNFRGTATSTADGSYTLDVDPNKFYALYAQKDHAVSDCRTRVILIDSPPAINLTLNPGRHIVGRVTQGHGDAPVAGNHVELERLDGTYGDLPKEEQVLPKKDNHSITAFIDQSTLTDSSGNFEFYAPAGDYYTRTYIEPDDIMVRFSLGDEFEKRVDMHAKGTAIKQVTGRVVRVDKPNEGVGEVVLSGEFYDDTGAGGRSPDGVADKQGNFMLPAASSDYYLAAISPDRKWGSLRLVRATENPVRIIVSPTASVTGRLVDEKGNALADRGYLWATIVETKAGGFSDYSGVIGGTAKTDAQGNFTITGLLPGRKYEIMTTKPSAMGGWDRDQAITTITPESAAAQDLGDVRVGARPNQ